MSEKYQPPTEFIEGLGIDFVKPPQPPFLGYDDRQMHRQVDRALGYAAMMPGTERAHISGTPLFSRNDLLLLKDDSIVEASAPEGEKVFGWSALVCLPVSQDGESVGFRGFSVETALVGDGLKWSPLKYRDGKGSELTDPRDLDAAVAVLHAATRKPAKRMQKAITGYLVSGRKPWFNRAIGAPEYEDMVEGVKARLK